MPHVPFLGRLNPIEYFALTLSFSLLFLETIVRSITLLLPGPIIHIFYRISRSAFNSLSSPYSRRARNRKKAVSSPIAQAQDFVELCELFGYYAEEHIVQTKDGYLLGLHRLGWRKGEESQHVNNGHESVQKKIVYLHHGLLMNSEVWVCLTEQERCLPFLLVEKGYDVWLGNNRGNKYSKKSLHSIPTESKFWNFSMDQFAFHDIPDSIEYILTTTHQPSLSYIGFSQGTAQAFATLSIHPTLNNKVDVFVALAPAMAPPGLASGVVASLVKSNPSVLFLAFGRRAILGSATMWQALLYPAIFTWFIDKSLAFLFGWQTKNITPHQKLAAYPHLYSFTSTKCVVHWFQIIRNGTFQMYDDEVTTPWAVGNSSKYYKVAKFPTRNIKTPICLIYGGSDSLVDIQLMMKELPMHTMAIGIPKYEHLDLLWASDVDKLVFPHVLEALENHGAPNKTNLYSLGWASRKFPGSFRNGILDLSTKQHSQNGSLPPGSSETERECHQRARQVSRLAIDGSTSAVITSFTFKELNEQEHLDETDVEEEEEEEEESEAQDGILQQEDSRDSRSLNSIPAWATQRQVCSTPPGLTAHSRKTVLDLRQPSSSKFKSDNQLETSNNKVTGRQPGQNQRHWVPFVASGFASTSSPLNSGITGESSQSRPEGWWSSTSSTAESSPGASKEHLKDIENQERSDSADTRAFVPESSPT